MGLSPSEPSLARVPCTGGPPRPVQCPAHVAPRRSAHPPRQPRAGAGAGAGDPWPPGRGAVPGGRGDPRLRRRRRRPRPLRAGARRAGAPAGDRRGRRPRRPRGEPRGRRRDLAPRGWPPGAGRRSLAAAARGLSLEPPRPRRGRRLRGLPEPPRCPPSRAPAPGGRPGVVPRRPHPPLPPPALRRRAGDRERPGALAPRRRGGARQDGRGLPDLEPPRPYRPRRRRPRRGAGDAHHPVAGRAVEEAPPGLRPLGRQAPRRRGARPWGGLQSLRRPPPRHRLARAAGGAAAARRAGGRGRHRPPGGRRGAPPEAAARAIPATPPTAPWRRSPRWGRTSSC